MMELRFVWDPVKAQENVKNHGIRFEEAQTVFYDEFGVEFFDDRHSEWEERFLLLGLSSRLNLLLVCHCYREGESVIRIISARKATPREARFYRR
jgi:hypothetical protein